MLRSFLLLGRCSDTDANPYINHQSKKGDSPDASPSGLKFLMSKVVDVVTELAFPIVSECGCSLWDVEYVKEGGDWFLRIYIDKDTGVSIDDCERVSRLLDPVLDEKDPVPDSYILEVSSAGIEREIKKPEHFLSSIGQTILVRFYHSFEGKKQMIGVLESYREKESLTLSTEESTVEIPLREISKAKWYYEF